MSGIYIFLGPSLTLEEAQEILPDAHYLNPARCGDILRVLRLQPMIIGLIDGYFENTTAIWHKELLYALQQGVRVVGGGSMGALRASELTSFGMEWVGEIATAYVNHNLIDDDEVAVLHNPTNFTPTTDAMINIRSILKKAVANHIMTEKLAKKLETTAKMLPYQERIFTAILDHPCFENDIQEIVALKNWLSFSNNNIKAQDARCVLEKIVDTRLQKSHQSLHPINRSIFFRTLQNNIACRPFNDYYSWLPIQEKVALAARCLGSNYRLCRRLAQLLAVCFAIAEKNHVTPSESALIEIINTNKFGFNSNINNASWEIQNDCIGVEKKALIDHITSVYELISKNPSSKNVEDYMLLLLKMSDKYSVYKVNSHSAETLLLNFKKNQPNRYHLIYCYASSWAFIEQQFLDLNLKPSQKTLQTYSDSFRAARKLYHQENIEEWLVQHDMSWNDYQYLIEANARLSKLVIQNNIDILDINIDYDRWWLLDALRLTGMYGEAKALLDNLSLKAAKQKIIEENENLEELALSLDFVGGERDFLCFLETSSLI